MIADGFRLEPGGFWLNDDGNLEFEVRRDELEEAIGPELAAQLDHVLQDADVAERVDEAIGSAIYGIVWFACRRRSDGRPSLRAVAGGRQ